MGRERDQAISAEDYQRADELRGGIEERRAELDGARRPAAGAGGHGRRHRGHRLAAHRDSGSQLTQEERERLLKLEERLHERVVGQDEAVEAVSEAVRRARAGLGDPNRPDGSFLFLGPTGVGKTELARALAEALFGSDDVLVRFDMSEFQEPHSVSRLGCAARLRRVRGGGSADGGGAPPAVRGPPLRRDREGAPRRVQRPAADPRRRPSHRRPGPHGRLKNTVVIMTSNLGSDRIQAYARREGGSFDDLKEELMDVLRQNSDRS